MQYSAEPQCSPAIIKNSYPAFTFLGVGELKKFLNYRKTFIKCEISRLPD
jgi:hypothetical protein